jgi:hypothetical protein
MAGRIFNPVSVSAVVGILFLFATLWNLQSRDILYTHLEENEKATPTPTPTEFPEITAENSTIAENTTEVAIPEPEPTRLSFLEIATKYGTDKVTTHHYNYSEFRALPTFFNLTNSTVYEKYLEPIRDKPLKMLEIGLGCNMAYGPGKSYYTWLEFLPNVDLYYIEYDRGCVEKWAPVIVQGPYSKET